ncbi:MAG: hypothetical protein AAF226_03160 [Verrucomicrobiota bacterium]
MATAKLRFFRRHILSLLIFGLGLGVALFWWRSTKNWSSWHAETPVGIFRVQTEASLIGVGAQFMRHEHRWSAWHNSDPVWGERMRFPLRWPEAKSGNGVYFLLLPFWQLVLLFLIAGLSLLAWELLKLRQQRQLLSAESVAG